MNELAETGDRGVVLGIGASCGRWSCHGNAVLWPPRRCRCSRLNTGYIALGCRVIEVKMGVVELSRHRLGANCPRDGIELAVLSLDDASVLARYFAWPRRMVVPG
ncbi:hypothetical protein FVEG_17053 [Fusarium verticillioides 7600]|uniref:Uncharacterized protein n=1 Tax=Gibberella moniliformis (strain M3125 / FGSC 7600) TaxID=334819 RepID=W7MPQ9_GIBM7|nr:hypothetical protein FVEG_17053 [Fusarium verticillioides 7600]EWG53061.1 hypothetical protein FVEG_17053 [Fusarium verticillioides 7600]